MSPEKSSGASVVLMCVKNAGKSPMAAALMRQGAPDITVDSAGTAPAAAVNALSAEVLHEVGVDISGHHPKAVTEDLLRAADLVVVLGGDAHLDAVEGTRVVTWTLDEPSDRGIDGAQRMRLVRDDIRARTRALAAELTLDA